MRHLLGKRVSTLKCVSAQHMSVTLVGRGQMQILSEPFMKGMTAIGDCSDEPHSRSLIEAGWLRVVMHCI